MQISESKNTIAYAHIRDSLDYIWSIHIKEDGGADKSHRCLSVRCEVMPDIDCLINDDHAVSFMHFTQGQYQALISIGRYMYVPQLVLRADSI